MTKIQFDRTGDMLKEIQNSSVDMDSFFRLKEREQMRPDLSRRKNRERGDILITPLTAIEGFSRDDS